MNKTRGNLVPAKIIEVDKKGKPVSGGITIPCMFNPFEYTVSKSNTYVEEPRNQGDVPQGEFFKSGAQTLRLNLVFDTFESGEDVSQTTRNLWKFMLTKDQSSENQEEKITPPQAAFEWGVFKFVAFITNMSQRFTLFKHDGTPVRAKIDVTFTQYVDVEDYRRIPQNPTSGGGAIERIWRVVAGDRLDTIAENVYHDATKWRLIAERNHISNPLSIKPGELLKIPFE